LASAEGGSFFFQPFQLHFEPPDLLEQLGGAGLYVRGVGLGVAAEHGFGPANRCFFQPWIKVGWTLNCAASSLMVRSPLSAARATWALKLAE
jgi:hypothetical protein